MSLNLDDLADPTYIHDHPGLTLDLARAQREACLVCLLHHNHAPGVTLHLDGNHAPGTSPELIWQIPLPANAPQAHADLQDATEAGAVALAILLVTQYTPYRIAQRAVKGFGFDYYLAPRDEYAPPPEHNFLKNRIHLEVSGILTERRGNTRQARLKRKQLRFHRLNTPTPRLIIIVAFNQPAATIEAEGHV